MTTARTEYPAIVVPRARSITFTTCEDCPNIHISFRNSSGDIYAEGLMTPEHMENVMAAVSAEVIRRKEGRTQ
jgi:hypothetical protein